MNRTLAQIALEQYGIDILRPACPGAIADALPIVAIPPVDELAAFELEYDLAGGLAGTLRDLAVAQASQDDWLGANLAPAATSRREVRSEAVANLQLALIQ